MGNNYNEVDWNEIQDQNSGKNIFMKLEEGSNVIRVLGNPVQFSVHWLETPSGKRKINAPSNPETAQRLVDAGFKAKRTWMLKVLDRSDDTFKLLEAGTQIVSGIKALSRNPKWGKVSGYDITIHRGKQGSSPLYNVSPDPHEALNASFKNKFVEFNDSLDFDRILAPATDEDVFELMEWNLGKTSAFPNSADDDIPFSFE